MYQQRPLSPAENQVESEESDSEEQIICTHIPFPPSGSTSPNTSPNNTNTGKNGFGAKDAGIAAGSAVAAGVAVPTVATAGLTAVGFTGSGVAAGSMAAGIQAGIGNVAAGSIFATCQSIGATGGFAILGPVGIAAGLIAGGSYLGYRAFKTFRKKRTENEEEKAAKKKLGNDNDHPGGGGGGVLAEGQKPMCSKCREKLLRRNTKKFFDAKNTKK